MRKNPALALLKKDHETVKKLFNKFEKAKNRADKKKIVKQALLELRVHAAIEEEIFYPAVRKPVGADTMNEADEEHHVAKVLVAELDAMTGSEDHYDAKFTVLAENVRHHIREEENEMFPKTKKARVDYEALSEKMLQRKEQLLAEGVAPTAEDRMVGSNPGKGDSPAQAAHRRKPRKS
jgi:hemerythrin superfamily protein